MLKRKKLSQVSPFSLILVAFGLSLLIYNFITIITQYQNAGVRKQTSGEKFVNPVTKTREHAKTSRNDKSQQLHVAMTTDGSPYSRWQSRIMYYWFKKTKNLPGSIMGNFTRILHWGKPDNLIDEIPTVVVDPLPESLNLGYVVLNRPWAFLQWLHMVTIEEEYILMTEPDHLLLKPLPNLAYGGHPAAFPFFYIEPKKHEKIIRQYFPKEMGSIINVDPIGNSPVIIQKDLLKKIVPTWLNISLQMVNDPEAEKAFGWVLEMYGYAVAAACHHVKHALQMDLMLQPPFDWITENKYILHYTYGNNFNMKGKLMHDGTGEWRFDKRDYEYGPIPQNISLPPRGTPQSVVNLVKMLNEATANLPNWDTT